ncbi:MAG: leucine-rich repeat protein [Bacteroidales bacterium]|nr:leucine-rich repeat protein [Candidatus Sodaliphilus aphodohippi]
MKKLLLTSLLSIAAFFMASAYDIEIDGYGYDINEDGQSVTLASGDYSLVGSVTIPSSVTFESKTYPVTVIGYKAFDHFESMTAVTIPNTVTTINASAFIGCSALKNINFGSSVEFIGSEAFAECTALTSVTLPASVNEVETRIFMGCSSLTSITVASGNTTYDSRNNCNAIVETESNTLVSGCKSTVIPSTIKSIGDGAFRGCIGLTSVVIPNSVTYVGSCSFCNCTDLTTATIGSAVEWINWSAFDGCSALKTLNYNARACNNFGSGWAWGTQLDTLNIGNSVVTIPSWFMEEQSELTTLTIGSAVREIGSCAFSDCAKIKTINSYAVVAPVLEEEVFNSETYENATLYVPHSGVHSYKVADGWKEFLHIEEKGDLNSDRKIDIADLNAIINIILGFTPVYDLYRTDINGDFIVDIKDLNAIINIILGL